MKRIVDVSVDDDGDPRTRPATISATYNHPFWVPALKAWLPAAVLTVGLPLRTSTGATVQVTALREHTERTRVHNLTVADLHTYFVVARQASVLVHNTVCVRMSSIISDDPFFVRAAEEASKNQRVQQDLDHLFDRLSKGDMSPGRGTSGLTGTGISYARTRSGARLFYREVNGGVQIVAKASKANEKAVIKRLLEIYGK
jgi:hypothetical protein